MEKDIDSIRLDSLLKATINTYYDEVNPDNELDLYDKMFEKLVNGELDNVFFFDQIVQYRIHRQRRDGLDAGFADDVLAVGDDGVDGDVEGVGDFVVFQSFGEADEHLFLAVGEGVGVGFVAVGLEGVGHLVEGRFDALEVVVEFDDAGELPLVLRFDVGGDQSDETQVRQVVKLGADGGAFGVVV